ncbi:hypothetical protein ATANTOWER_014719 [Ataeniobius toweri]|uniref:Uncharacterized protein n=1 Tax=Ataeniobius toweri TaxID=208326 RepID=A0ABU7BU44_9TELE|nr:hypothetical protein [Ataeniobius toweri]
MSENVWMSFILTDAEFCRCSQFCIMRIFLFDKEMKMYKLCIVAIRIQILNAITALKKKFKGLFLNPAHGMGLINLCYGPAPRHIKVAVLPVSEQHLEGEGDILSYLCKRTPSPGSCSTLGFPAR